MKFLFSITITLLLNTIPLAAQTKRALIIAIGTYPTENGWPAIHAINDVAYIRQALNFQGFTNEHITVLQDSAATKQAVVSAIQTLTERSEKGDKIVIHISSHGQQITDDSNEELDAYDETIVCYRAPSRLKDENDPYDGREHLTDDELDELITSLRIKLGPSGDILLTADSCHSGTISRGQRSESRQGRVRGGKPLDLRRNRVPQKRPLQTESHLFDNSPSIIDRLNLSPYVVIAAAKDYEENKEYVLPSGAAVGSLSYALYKTLRTVQQHETYRLLFNRITTEMKQMMLSQSPSMDGNYDRELFGGKAVVQTPYYRIQEVHSGGKQIGIPAGLLEMVYPKTVVKVCPAGTTNPAEISSCISGTVVNADQFTGTVLLQKPIIIQKETDYWVFVTERSYGDLSLSISMDRLLNVDSRKIVQNAVQKVHDLFTLKAFPESQVYFTDSLQGEERVLLLKRTKDHLPIGTPLILSKLTDIEVITRLLRNYVQGRFFRSFGQTTGEISVEMELLPNLSDGQVVTDSAGRRPFLQDGALVFKNGERTSVRVTNKGQTRIYFNVIDIQPDDLVNILFPVRDTPDFHDSADNYGLDPGQSVIIPHRVKLAPPYGRETFKVLASQEQFDLRNAIEARAITTGSKKVLERIFARTGGASSRSVDPTTYPDSSIGTFELPFLIVPNHD
ncbi:caspase family protein [Larkinella bovis]|uniref:Caspase family protein n=1 Tax=Larkinella bovis TaxID=683041 RepID=A0ABW0IIG2_9BACT